MTISVSITKENKDGSADALIRFEKEDLEILVQWGFVAMLKEAINEYATADQINARANARNAGRGRKPAVKKTKPTIAKPIAKKKK
jgi:hypothetical protein